MDLTQFPDFGISPGLPTVPYLTVQYRILTLVPSVPYGSLQIYGTENVPFFEQFCYLMF